VKFTTDATCILSIWETLNKIGYRGDVGIEKQCPFSTKILPIHIILVHKLYPFIYCAELVTQPYIHTMHDPDNKMIGYSCIL